MYDKHAVEISAEIYERPLAMRDAILFASLSIQQAITIVPAMLSDVREKGASSDHLWGMKRDTYVWAEENYREIWALARDEETTARAFIWRLLDCPGLGIVKAAFVAQLAGFDVACLDTQNEKRLGLRPQAFKLAHGKAKKGKASARKLDRYLEMTQGKAREMWNDWCRFVSPIHKRSPFEISRLHLAIVAEGAEERSHGN